jgi:hypothetical protein
MSLTAAGLLDVVVLVLPDWPQGAECSHDDLTWGWSLRAVEGEAIRRGYRKPGGALVVAGACLMMGQGYEARGSALADNRP